MSETNGHGKSRLDRIEEMLERHSVMMISIDASIERQERANEEAHARFQEEDRRLLTAQILMNGAMQKTNEAVEKLSGTVEKLGEKVDKLSDGADKMLRSLVTLELKMEETTEKLNALIETVDGINRRPPDLNLPAAA